MKLSQSNMPPTQTISQAPLILGIDTSGAHCSVGVARGDELLFVCEIFQPFVHDAALAELCRLALNSLKVSMRSLSAIAVVAGPGSFTGLRIGVSFARAMCLPLDAQQQTPQCISLSSLQIIAVTATNTASMRQKKTIIAIIPSHKNVVYVQKFSLDATPIEPMQCCPADDVFANLDVTALYCGRGINKYIPYPCNDGFECEIRPPLLLQRAFQEYQREKFTNPFDLVPHYGQDFIPRLQGE